MATARSESFAVLRALPGWLWLFAVCWIVLAVYWQWLVHSDGIFGEMWDTLPAFRELHTMTLADIGRELLRKYALVHVIALPKLGFWLDFQFFGATGRFTRSATFLALLLCFIVAVLIAVRDYRRPVACVLLALLLFFNGCQTFVMNWESLLQYYLAILFSLLAFLLYGRWPGRLWWPSVLLLFAAFCCGASIGAIAGFSLMLLLRARRGEVSRAALAGFAVFLSGMVWLLWPERQDSLMQQATGTFFWNAPNLLLQYLAYPASAWGDMRWLGALTLLVVVVVCWRTLTQDRLCVADHVAMAFFLVACTIVLGRYRFMGLDGDIMRYYGFMTPLFYFLLLHLLSVSLPLFVAAALPVCSSVVVAGLAVLAVTSNLANKMELARVVALNGNHHHFASQRLDALRGLPATLENSRDYLAEYGMDIFHERETQVPQTEQSCSALLLEKRSVTKGRFVDYVLQESPDNRARLSELFLTNGSSAIVYYGTVFAVATQLEGWSLPLRAVNTSHWPLLVPLRWLPLEQRRLYTHLPRETDPARLQWWGRDAAGAWCRLQVGF